MSIIVDYVHNRIKRNKNFLCAITGPTGSGKSYDALSLAEQLDPTFSPDRIVFDIKSFMLLINSSKLRPGSVIVFDEFGVANSAYSWQSVESKFFLYLMQTFRNMNLIVFFTVPHLSFISAGSRKLLHAHFETVSIDARRKVSILKPLFLQISQREGKMYWKYLRIGGTYGKTPVSKLSVKIPSSELLAAYEQKKNAYTDRLNKSILAEIEEKQPREIKTLEMKYLEARDVVLQEIVKGKNITSIAAVLKATTGTAKEYIERLERDGYEILSTKIGKRVIYHGYRPPVGLSHIKKDVVNGVQLNSAGGGS